MPPKKSPPPDTPAYNLRRRRARPVVIETEPDENEPKRRKVVIIPPRGSDEQSGSGSDSDYVATSEESTMTIESGSEQNGSSEIGSGSDEQSMVSDPTSNSSVDIQYASEESEGVEEAAGILKMLMGHNSRVTPQSLEKETQQMLRIYSSEFARQMIARRPTEPEKIQGREVAEKELMDKYEQMWKKVLEHRPEFESIFDTQLSERDRQRLFEKIVLFINQPEFSDGYFELYHSFERALKEYALPQSVDPKEYEKFFHDDTKDLPLGVQIMNSGLSDTNKKILREKYLDFKSKSERYDRGLERWIRRALKIPYKCREYDLTQVSKYQSILNSKIALLDDVKEQLFIQFYNRVKYPNSYKITCLVGPPGIGKTFILQEFAKTVGMEFRAISMGAAHDVSYLKGHSVTYTNSVPGVIASTCLNMGSMNGMIYFDEIDKLADSESVRSHAVLMCFLELLDQERNSQFEDDYFSPLTFDLSKMWFILSINNKNVIDQINPALSSRMEYIYLSPYLPGEKVKIALTCIIPKLLHQYDLAKNITFTKKGLETTDIIFTTKGIERILSKSCVKEPGVRQYQRNCETVIQNLNYLNAINTGKLQVSVMPKFYNPSLKFPIKVTPEVVDIVFTESEEKKDKLTYYS